MPLKFARSDQKTIPLFAVDVDGLVAWQAGLSKQASGWVSQSGFSAAVGSAVVIPDTQGNIMAVAVGMGDATARRRSRFAFAAARAKLPEGTYALQDGLTGEALDEAALGWLLAGYRFETYAKNPAPKAQMVAPAGVDAVRLEIIAAGEAQTRDLINTPPSDMMPSDLEAAARAVAASNGAAINVVSCNDLLDQNFPMIHAVGRASVNRPRLIDMAWGETGPRLTLVGKGVCFDTGGLNIKPGASMGLMKKDMGGAATVLGLAQMIMALKLPIRLRVLIPAAENSISADAYRPQDILRSRKGLTVEINNTDAEGRLVLADALTLADEEKPDLVVSMATLTGAARVAVGTDIAAFFATSDADAAAVVRAAERVRDPVWQMPFWEPYETLIEPGIADLDNAPKGGMAGAITAALFLRRFVTETPRYMHFDISAWQPVAAPARPKGGVGQGARALLQALPELLGL